MPEQFSLLGRAWLPVALVNGQRAIVRPCDITRPDIIRLATGRPDCDISLTEFLIGLLAVAIGPADNDDWAARYAAPPTAAALEAAFAPFAPAMMLDGDKARFFQDREPFEGAMTQVDAFFMDTPADHFQVDNRTMILSRAGAALALATLQTSAPAGGAGHRTSLRGGGPLTTLVVPGVGNLREPTLWQRLWANVPADFLASSEEAERVFPWLMDTRISDKGGKTTTPTDVHKAQAFFGMPRRIRLAFAPNTEHRRCDLTGVIDDVVVTGYVTKPWGTNYTDWSKGHPLSPYYRQKEADVEFLPLHLQSSRIGYRQWVGMAMRPAQSSNGSSLRSLAACVVGFAARSRTLDRSQRHPCQLLVAGYAMDNMKPLDFSEALLPLLITGDPVREQIIADMAQAWVVAADTVQGQLSSSVRTALYGAKVPAEKMRSLGNSTPLHSVKSRFWGDTEGDFFDQLRTAAQAIEDDTGDLDDDDGTRGKAANTSWLTSLKRHALAIFDDAVPIEDADSDRIADIIAGRKMLGLMLAGYGKGGEALFKALGMAPSELKPKKPKGGKK
jgi:CRISPR system Cascade subunit CasA